MTLLVRATDLVNGKPGFSDPQGTKTPEPIDLKLDVSDYVGDITPHAKFGTLFPRGRGYICMKLSIRDPPCLFFLQPLLFYFLALLYRSHRLTDFRV